MPAPEIIQCLVKRFSENREEYRSGKYNEAQLRQEFLDPFFEALGWDMTNKKGYSLDYREVIHEDSIDIEGVAKAPDYAFRLGGNRKFFVEAKKPAVNIKYEIHPAYQLRRYAWNLHLPLSILTDFEEFAVYDCRNKPNHTDSAATGRTMFFTYDQYIEKWDVIAGIFSPEAIQKGAFEKYAIGNKGKRGTTEVDDAFLADIEEWRTLLARNIALRNAQVLDERQLNYAVQMTIDRIIFLRICEDRSIEPEDQLRIIAQSPNVYAGLLGIFTHADQKYNSGLFHFSTEKGQTSPADTFTPTLKIDDKVLKGIITSLYFPCPYIFKEIPVEILGQVYEQFLGKVIRLTPGHQAKVEEKPEVRKAGGVYYTPTYIVDYIVKNTVAKLLEGKNPKSASTLKIVDPACGSGSFLLGAYQYLLDWHEDWYTRNVPEKWAKGKSPALVPTDGGEWKLTTAEKKRILVNNIHGVDIDAQAVEVTKLSLLLKVLEEESGQMSLGLERVLPDLGKNIQCGNSLIGEDYFEGRLVVDEAERQRVNPFDWGKAFPQVFAQGGFDAVIGNPPYVRQETLGNDKQYYQKHYQVYAGMADLYSYFIEKGISLLALGGMFSYIVANKWMRANYGKALRKWLRTKCIEEITDFGDLPVFENATTYPCIIRVSNNSPHMKPLVTNVKSLEFSSLAEYVETNGDILDQSKFSEDGWSLSSAAAQHLLEHLKHNSVPLEEYVGGKIYRGVLTGLNEAFVIDLETRNRLIAEDPKSAELIKPFLIGREIKRYQPPENKAFLILIPKGWTKAKSNNASNAWKWLNGNYPAIAKHLSAFEKKAIVRQDKGDYWWELRACAYYDEFEKDKIIYPNICKRPEFSLGISNFYTNQKCFIIPKNDKYLLGILNSQVMMFFFQNTIPKLRGDFFEPGFVFMKDFPVHKTDFTNPKEVRQHDRMVALVERMLALHKRNPITPQEEERLRREIQSTDTEID
ncbi:MAG: TaqI-like C-terminal specificity domain-containing protein, partial [Chloroflexota bacterium]